MIVDLFLLALMSGLLVLALVKNPRAVPGVTAAAMRQLLVLVIRIPLALITAVALGELIPPDAVAPLMGAGSGWIGVLIAIVFGALLPGGPIATFPVALILWRAGAGEVQMIALLNSWAIFAFNRVLSYELPVLGSRWLALRLASSWTLPVVTAALAALYLLFTGNSGAGAVSQ